MLLMRLFGAGCLIFGALVYFCLFLRRSRYDSPLDYARALSLNPILDRKLAFYSARPVCWLKCYLNVLLPFIGIAGGLSLVFLILRGGALNVSSVLLAASYLFIFADLLFLRFFDAIAFLVHLLACLTAAAASLMAHDGGFFVSFIFPSPLLDLCFWTGNLFYAVRRLPLFLTNPAECPEEEQPESEAFTERLTWGYLPDDEAPEPKADVPAERFAWNAVPSAGFGEADKLDRMFSLAAQSSAPVKLAQKCRPHKVRTANAQTSRIIRLKASRVLLHRATVTGTLFFGRQQRLERCKTGQAVLIRRMARSEFQVLALESGRTPAEIGTLGQQERQHLSLLLSPGGELRGQIESLTRGDDGLLRCEICWREN